MPEQPVNTEKEKELPPAKTDTGRDKADKPPEPEKRIERFPER
jgi:hypothetical protein